MSAPAPTGVAASAAPDAMEVRLMEHSHTGATLPLSLRPVQARAARAADGTGRPAEEIERLPFDLSALESEGVFINVDARGFGLLDRRLDWQALGVTLPATGAELAFRQPRCALLPDGYRLPLLRPAAHAHAALHRYSYHFRLVETVFETPAYRWVPWRAFPSFEQAFEAAQAQLAAAADAFAADYEAVREQVLEAFRQLAADSARRLLATGRPVPEGFEGVVVQGVLRALPTPDDLRTRLVLRYRVGVIQLGSEMLAEQRRAAEERRRLEGAEALVRLERERQAAASRLVQEELWAKQERLRQQLRADEEERRREAAVKERLRRLKLEAARERMQEALSPLEEGARQLHAAVYASASALRTALEKHGHLPGGSARRARSLVRWFKVMNWQSDQQLEALLGELERLASRPAGGRRPRGAGGTQVDQVLGDIIALTYADARALVEPNRMAALEL